MDKIPIAFDYQGQHYEGHFNQVTGGASSNLYHLMIDNYYRGQLFYTDNYGWQFSSNDKKFEELGEYFGEVITDEVEK